MSQVLVVDAAFPPSPAQWVADMNAIGAQGGAIYVYGGFTNYTAAHVQAAQAAGKHVVPIIVPGNAPPAPPLYAAAAPYGLTSGLLVYDVESGSEPGPVWVQQAVDEANTAGWRAGVYCGQALRSSYSAGWFWLSQWPYAAGIWQPVPTLIAGASAWQYAHDVNINGSLYDVSIFNEALFGGTNVANSLAGLAGTDPNVQRLLENANDIDWMLSSGQRHGLAFDPTGVITDVNEPTWGFWLGDQLTVIQKAIAALNQPVVDPSVLAAALASDKAFLDALATAIVHKLGVALSGS